MLMKILFGRSRRDSLRIPSSPHHSVNRTIRPLDTVTWPAQMPRGLFGYGSKFFFTR